MAQAQSGAGASGPDAAAAEYQSVLKVQDLTKRFGGLTAVEDLSFDLYAGSILGLIGPNGAGKSTTFGLVAGALAPTAGSVRLRGEELLGLPPHEIARRGVLRTFQHNMPFAGMTLIDNVMVGAHTHMSRGVWRLVLAPGSGRAREMAARERAEELIEFVGLSDVRDEPVTTLSFGQGRLLELARALAAEPSFIMLDEPAAGLAYAECERLGEIIRGISERGIGVLLIEHDMRFLMPLADRVVVLNFGRKIAEGTPDAVRRDPAVVDAYLGEIVVPDGAGRG